MKYLNFIFLFLFLFIGLSSTAYAESEANNDCSTANTILTDGTSMPGSSSTPNKGTPDYDFFTFSVSGSGELNVTITSENNKDLKYSLVTTSCPNSDAGTLNNSSITLSTNSTGVSNYYIRVYGTENAASSYTISARFTTHTPSAGADLQITKNGSIDTILIYDKFYYTINVSNVGDTNESNVVVQDDLPSGMRVDYTETNTASAEWNCVESSGIPTCTLNNDLQKGQQSSITLYVFAPPVPGAITNEANVTSSGTDVDTTNNTATETTTVTNEIDTAEHLCYIEETNTTFADYETKCDKKGNFYYGRQCEATVLVQEVNTTQALSYIKVYKMYAPDTGSGTYNCTSSTLPASPSRNCNDITNTTDFGSYTEGYAIDIDETSVTNVTAVIKDTGTDKNPRIDGIAMFGDYWSEETASDGTPLRYHHSGRIYTCSGASEGGIEITSSADVIDTPIGYDTTLAGYYNTSTDTSNSENNIKYIQTMVASDIRNIEGVYLNLAGETALYQYSGSLAYSIVPYLTNETCDSIFENIIDPNTNEQLVIDIPSNYYSATGQMIVSEKVRKTARIQLIFIDPNGLSVEGQRCLERSSTTGNFARMAQCVNSEVQYKTAFGQDAWDRCGDGNGNPCQPSNHGYSCGPGNSSCAEYNPLYDNELGCYMCTFNIQPACSTDNFSIRPKRFDLGMSHPDAPNLLRAGKSYGISLTAKNADNAISTDYTITDHHFNDDLNINTTRFLRDGTKDTNNLLHGTSELNISTTAYSVGGYSSLNTSGPATNGSADEIVKASYNDVGKVALHIYENVWAYIDDDDTPADCNSTTHYYICGDKNVTFIPHHFSVSDIHLRNHRDGNFTYLSNDLNMSAHLDVNISAMNAQNGITQNFRQGSLYYENPVSVDLNVTEWLGVASLHPEGNSVHKHDIPTQTLLGFGGSDSNGIHIIDWNASNLTQRIMFNYERKNNQPVNPFRVPGTDANITVVSTYIDPDTPSSPANITGSGIGDRNATFQYARAKSSQDFYEVTTPSVKTPIMVIVYCDLISGCASFNIDTINGQTNNYRWWLSWEHVASSDGNITLVSPPTVIEGAGSPSVTTNLTISEGQDKTVTVTSGATALPMTVKILLDTETSLTPAYTNSWVIYNPNSDISDPDPFYRVRFIGTAGSVWTGYGKTGHVVGDDINKKKTKRLEW